MNDKSRTEDHCYLGDVRAAQWEELLLCLSNGADYLKKYERGACQWENCVHRKLPAYPPGEHSSHWLKTS